MRNGFTVVELLVEVAMVAVVSAVAYFFLNPLELAKRERDADRLTDLSNLRQAIITSVQEATSSAILCEGTNPPCSGSSNKGSKAADGTGWVKVNVSAQKSVPLPTLPVDLINSDQYHYTYCSDGKDWEIDAVLESDKQAHRMKEDEGNDANVYEVGSNLNLIAPSGGTCTY